MVAPNARLPEAAALLKTSFPTLHTKPDHADIERRAGVRDETGRVAATISAVPPAEHRTHRA